MNKENYFTSGLLFLVLGNLTESWFKYVNFTMGALLILASFGREKTDKK